MQTLGSKHRLPTILFRSRISYVMLAMLAAMASVYVACRLWQDAQNRVYLIKKLDQRTGQGYGRSLWLMHGFFRANGGCGYIKKPDFLLKEGPHGEVFDPKANYPVKKTLKVRVYMGDGWRLDFKKTHFDAYSPPDFYTKIGIAGVPADCIMKKTRVLEDNWVPLWDEEFTFPLRVPELALLRVEVHEYDMSEKDDFAGQTCLPVAELRQGIRTVPIFDRKGLKFKSVKLLMRFEFV